jgi:glycosyltransferase involved in cell wall biosynthesis
VTVVPNGVDIDEFHFAAQPDGALRRELGLDAKTVLGFVGSFYAYEGLDLLIDAIAILAVEGKPVHAFLVGGGPQEAKLREQAAARGLGDRVTFAGRVPHADVQRYYDAIDVLVYPRRRMRLTEIVTPLKPLEAMAQGRILIASDVGGHRELIRNGENGFLFSADDVSALVASIRDVLARRPMWGSMRERARRYVESERTWARSVAEYAGVYASADRARAARSLRSAA